MQRSMMVALMKAPGRTPNRGQAPELTPAIGRQHLDDLVDDYVSWREAYAAASASYDHWKCAPREDQTLAISEYVAALNCERKPPCCISGPSSGSSP